ncbi:MAG: desulfoferrodoxin family protein [Methylococcales bacterium]
MDRRDFMRLSAVGAAGSMFLSKEVLAEAAGQSLAGGVYYTQEAPGHWKGKEATHLPSFEIAKAEGKLIVTVMTAHEMKGYEHYIVKHVLLDSNYQFLDEHLFDPTKDKTAVSTFTLKSYTGKLYALSMCNKHDVWLSSAMV